MDTQAESENASRFRISLEVVPDDPRDADPALVDAVGRDVFDALRHDGYTIKPVYTGARGGFLIDIVLPMLTAAWTQKDVILADGSALITIFTPVVLIAKKLHEAHEQRKGKDAAQQSPIKITVEIDGGTTSIEAPDLESAEAAMELAQRFQMQHPAIASKVTSQSSAKLKASVSKPPPRRRR
jgi:hypothetical protein